MVFPLNRTIGRQHLMLTSMCTLAACTCSLCSSPKAAGIRGDSQIWFIKPPGMSVSSTAACQSSTFIPRPWRKRTCKAECYWKPLGDRCLLLVTPLNCHRNFEGESYTPRLFFETTRLVLRRRRVDEQACSVLISFVRQIPSRGTNHETYISNGSCYPEKAMGQAVPK